MFILAAIAAIWALGLLSLAFTLPNEFLSPPDPDDPAAQQGGGTSASAAGRADRA